MARLNIASPHIGECLCIVAHRLAERGWQIFH